MTAQAIYDHFKINQGLREHMLRVAGVASCITNDTNVIQAALVHDLGNIVKTKFEIPELFLPEGIEYYREVQQAVFEKYGTDDHEVTEAMMQEINVPENLINITGITGLRNTTRAAQTGTFNEQVMMYSDLRVGTHGVVTIDERLRDLRKRTTPHRYSESDFETAILSIDEIESSIFSQVSIDPTDITDEKVATRMPKLLQTEIKGTKIA